ncbi:hypothetical protein AB4Z19_05440 [Pseudoduganella sp. RAF19]|uniref:hypothetical protein n=2 Tax=unclassified Pseudoduganella TaxID=2637179 RepID=UPI003F999671
MLRKQIFYVTSERLWACQWRRGELTAIASFEPGRDGLTAFANYLAQHGRVPAFLIADLVEEDFQRQLLPHVTGRAGRDLLARRVAQAFRDTPYRTALQQGRDEEGRRDDRVLLTALTNPALLATWIDVIEQQQTPLAGVYSATLLWADLLDELRLGYQHLLLVSEHSAGMRQIYFHDGALKFSRLVQANGQSADPAMIAAETARTRQFLNSSHFLAREEILHTVVITPAEAIERLSAACADRSDLYYHFEPIEAAAEKLGMDDAPPLADGLLLHWLAEEQPPSHYPLGEKGRYFRFWQIRVALYASSAVVGAACLIWTVANLIHYAVATSHSKDLAVETRHYDQSYARSMSDMPPAMDKTINMKAAVTIDQMVARQGPWPLAMMNMVSDALERSPQIRLTQLEWRANVPGSHPVTETTMNPMAATSAALVAPQSSLLLGIPKAPPQVLRLQAEVLVDQNEYRNVLMAMSQFTSELARKPRMEVQVEQLPFDVRPNVKLSGKAGAPGAMTERARFTLNLAWQP